MPFPRVALLAALALVSAGCAVAETPALESQLASTTAMASPMATDAGSATAWARATGAASATPTPLVDAGPLALDVPIGWHVRQSLANPSGNVAFAFLSPGPVPSECREQAGGGVCNAWPIAQLQPGDIVIAVRLHGMPGSQAPAGGDQITVAGMPAHRISGPADDACRATGGTQSIVVVLEWVPDTAGWMSIDACVAGPDVVAADTVFDAIVASVTLAGG